MKHLEIIDSHNDYQYVYHDDSAKLREQYDRMYGIIKASGYALASDSWPLNSGILLQNKDSVIAGSFFNLSKSPSSILIHIIFVEEMYRQQGIYKKMHSLIDTLGKQLGRSAIYSYIHADNQLMQEHIVDKIGYKPVMHLVRREIK